MKVLYCLLATSTSTSRRVHDLVRSLQGAARPRLAANGRLCNSALRFEHHHWLNEVCSLSVAKHAPAEMTT